jgi:hypothetical protein
MESSKTADDCKPLHQFDPTQSFEPIATGFHGTWIGMRGKTARVPIEAKEFQRPSCRLLCICDHIFIADVDQSYGQDFAPVIHNFHIFTITMGNILRIK